MTHDRPERWIAVSTRMDIDPKIADLTDAQFRAWVHTLIRAARLENGGRFASPGQYRMELGSYGRHLDALVRSGLLEEAEGEVRVVNWDAWQREALFDRTRRDRQARYRESHRGELAERERTRRASKPEPDPDGGGGEPPLAARYQQLVADVEEAPPGKQVGKVVDGYRAIFGPEGRGGGGRIAGLINDHPEGAVGVMRALAVAASRDVDDVFAYVGGVVRNAKRGATGGRRYMAQDPEQYVGRESSRA